MEKVNYFLQQLINGISCGSIYAMIAIGYSMVYGLLYLVNFAHGDLPSPVSSRAASPRAWATRSMSAWRSIRARAARSPRTSCTTESRRWAICRAPMWTWLRATIPTVLAGQRASVSWRLCRSHPPSSMPRAVRAALSSTACRCAINLLSCRPRGGM